ncbi:hypothetical protein BO82DRAFT_427306 [Aspergillus uvarum CBS 121591]|uniref:Uncharacterized protein n=1 Tax=Aspergillus uvarum CBS 121591 TaxID=1448315 RepID=A0A319D7M0_9EURO|nr:hypothetical protein BO82DRAFT_427306 [Aspergillus uvarum CBS 121591]PYH75932.1 hypothetical protein BO82DRAFT_427306 [Aspergillus uvarum CBS 121591]
MCFAFKYPVIFTNCTQEVRHFAWKEVYFQCCDRCNDPTDFRPCELDHVQGFVTIGSSYMRGIPCRLCDWDHKAEQFDPRNGARLLNVIKRPHDYELEWIMEYMNDLVPAGSRAIPPVETEKNPRSLVEYWMPVEDPEGDDDTDDSEASEDDVADDFDIVTDEDYTSDFEVLDEFEL